MTRGREWLDRRLDHITAYKAHETHLSEKQPVTRPARFVIRQLVFLVVVAAGLFLIRQDLVSAFLNVPYLNGFIIGVLVLGILYTIWLALRLWPDVNWIKEYQRERRRPDRHARLLAPMSMMIGERRGRLRLTAGAMRSLLDGIGTRLDEGRDISRYLIGLLVFLGLLGTFWGLLITIEEVIKVINSLSVAGGDDFAKVFQEFKEGMVNSLGGAGTAFSTSLFGLGGSLILGFLDLQAAQAQNRFYTDLEDWLSGMTRLTAVPEDPDGDPADTVPAYLQALLEHTAETMDEMQETLSRGEQERTETNRNLQHLVERLGVLTEQMRTEQNLMAKLADSQIEMKPILARLGDEQSFGRQELVNQLRSEFRQLAATLGEQQLEFGPVLQRMLDDNTAGRQEMLRELRNEFRILARTLASLTVASSAVPHDSAHASVTSDDDDEDPTPPDKRRTKRLD